MLKRNQRSETCELPLQLHGDNRKDFLEQIAAGDETMILQDDHNTKMGTMEWLRPKENSVIKAKVAARRE